MKPAAPDRAPGCVFEPWQPETQRLGQTAGSLGEVKALEAATHERLPVVTLEVSPIDLRLHLASQAAADSLRALAR